jgi:Ca2+-binding RTX toxin-like protein
LQAAVVATDCKASQDCAGIFRAQYLVREVPALAGQIANRGQHPISHYCFRLGDSATATLSNVPEYLTPTGNATFNAAGNNLDNNVIGATGANRLEGITGTNTYVVEGRGDILIEAASQGTTATITAIRILRLQSPALPPQAVPNCSFAPNGHEAIGTTNSYRCSSGTSINFCRR